MNKKLLLYILIIITLIILFIFFKPITISKEIDIDNYTKLTAIVHGPGNLYIGKKIETTDKQTMEKLYEYFKKLKLGRSIASEFDVTGQKYYLLIFDREDGETTIINIYDKKHIGISEYKNSRTYYVWFNEIDLEYINECLKFSQIKSQN